MLFTIITPANIAFLGDPAAIQTKANIIFKALNILKKFALIICHIVLEGAFGILFTSPLAILSLTSSRAKILFK